MNLNNLKIGQRLALAFGALLALTALMFAAAFMLLISNAQSSNAAGEHARRASLAAQWTAHTELNVTRTLAIAKATGAKFCAECGKPMQAPKTNCATCGAKIEAGARFCGECGAKA